MEVMSDTWAICVQRCAAMPVSLCLPALQRGWPGLPVAGCKQHETQAESPVVSSINVLIAYFWPPPTRWS